MPVRTVAKGLVFTAGLVGLVVVAAPSTHLTSASKATLDAQAAQLSQQIASQSAEIRLVAVQASLARSRLAADRANLARGTSQLNQARARVAVERNLLVHFAIAKFTDAPGSNTVITTLNTDQNSVAAQSTYESVASGYVVNVITTYQRAQEAVASLVSYDARQVAAATQAQQLLSQDLASLQAGVANEQATLASVHGQIATLVQQQLAQQAAQQAAALAARQAALLQQQQAAAQQQAAPQQPQAQGAPSAAGVSAAVSSGGAGSQWGGTPAPPSAQAFAALRNCESGGNYQDNTGNGYYGAYQFSPSTWTGLGFAGLPSAASPATQDQAAQIEQRQGGWSAWPECSLILGLD
ncbi:transglycosylase family protein [Ferrimicrobium sp.]|uniref:transglycosylase family protein n=1 Tax=Ferrimicrobium sp. TaxID=2926050 RepID=UPI002608A641|nr:transglycosylase family protein [Ferrimicrobium sp.]